MVQKDEKKLYGCMNRQSKLQKINKHYQSNKKTHQKNLAYLNIQTSDNRSLIYKANLRKLKVKIEVKYGQRF